MKNLKKKTKKLKQAELHQLHAEWRKMDEKAEEINQKRNGWHV
jgi:hypothetical protein